MDIFVCWTERAEGNNVILGHSKLLKSINSNGHIDCYFYCVSSLVCLGSAGREGEIGCNGMLETHFSKKSTFPIRFFCPLKIPRSLRFPSSVSLYHADTTGPVWQRGEKGGWTVVHSVTIQSQSKAKAKQKQSTGPAHSQRTIHCHSLGKQDSFFTRLSPFLFHLILDNPFP